MLPNSPKQIHITDQPEWLPHITGRVEYVDDYTVRLPGGNVDETTEKKAKPKQTGMALQLDAIKKISHQLERLGPEDAPAVVRFVSDWSQRRALLGAATIAPNGQLPLATKSEDPFG